MTSGDITSCRSVTSARCAFACGQLSSSAAGTGETDLIFPLPLVPQFRVSAITNRFLQDLQKWAPNALKLVLKPQGAIAIAARPGLGAIEIAALAPIMRILHFDQLEETPPNMVVPLGVASDNNKPQPTALPLQPTAALRSYS